MRTTILAALLICAGPALVPVAAYGQAGPVASPQEPATTGSAALAQGRARPAPSAGQQGGIYARPGRCRELAIGRRLSGLARQRFIKRCRIARRALPRPIPGNPTGAAPTPAVPSPAMPSPVVPSPVTPAPAKPAGQP